MLILASFGDFIGRFHPILVHLPIGFLMLTIILEWLDRKNQQYQSFVAYGWLFSALGAAFAALCGWFLAAEGSYAEDTLFWHRWLGIGITIVAFVGWQMKLRANRFSQFTHYGLNIFALLMLLIGGHQGGNLTHGSTYLVENAPASIQKLVGFEGAALDEYPQLLNPDSTLVYEDIIHPLLERTCYQCHNDDVARGGLNMTTPELLEAGGDNGPVIKVGNPLESELFRRLTLAVDNPKYMPPKGKPFSYTEKQLIAWWLSQPELYGKHVSEVEVPEDVKATLLALFALDTDPKPHYERVVADPIADEVIAQVEAVGFKVNTLSKDNYFLEVTWPLGKGDLTSDSIQVLDLIKENITWLNLGSAGISNDHLPIIGQCENLTRLRLENNPVSAAGIEQLKKLKHLESLNLYGTTVSDDCVAPLKEMVGLKRLFLWQTKVSETAVKDLQESKPDLKVDIGVEFSKISQSTD